jgi:hypothetical protein
MRYGDGDDNYMHLPLQRHEQSLSHLQHAPNQATTGRKHFSVSMDTVYYINLKQVLMLRNKHNLIGNNNSTREYSSATYKLGFFATGRDFICLVLVNTFPINNKYINYFITHNISSFPLVN